MPLLDIWSILEDPAWLFFGATVGVALLGLALLMVYPFGQDN
jgi:hypothetical protein